MTLCSVVNCKNLGNHVFPKDVKRRKLWKIALRRKNWEPSNYSRICAAHFKPEDYHVTNSYTGDKNFNKVLKKTAVPSIFSFTKVNPEKQQRLHRRLERSRKRQCFETPRLSGIQAENNGQFSDKQVPVKMEIDIDTNPQVEMTKSNQVNISTESKITQVNFKYIYGSIENYKNNDSVIAFYTGFETYEKFHFVFLTLSPMVHSIRYYGSAVKSISPENQFFLTMMKLRQNKCNFELAQFFEISPTTVFNIFITWINYIEQLWRKLNIWPEKELVLHYMPESFKQYDKNTRVILDGTKIQIKKAGKPVSQQASWSSYTHNNTLKILVGATPGGLLSYCSPAYADSINDRQTVKRSDLLNLCEPGDSILVDKQYNMQDLFIDKGIALNTPTSLKGKGQVPNVKDRKFASQRFHIKRLIGLMKTYKILKEGLHHNLVPLASKIFFVCLMCCNFRENIMK